MTCVYLDIYDASLEIKFTKFPKELYLTGFATNHFFHFTISGLY